MALANLGRDLIAAGETRIRRAGLLVRLPRARTPMIVTDEFIVEFRPGVTRTQIDSLNLLHHVQAKGKLGLLANDYVLTATRRSSSDALDLANRYHENPLVRFAHPNLLQLDEPASSPRGGIGQRRESSVGPVLCGAAGFEPNDPLFCDQWHLDNRQQHGGVIDADIDAPEAWAITRGSASVVIAILEGDGFDTLNVDILSNLWTNPGGASDTWAKNNDVHGWNFYDPNPLLVNGLCDGPVVDAHTNTCGSDSFDDDDDMYHGTEVAGLAAGRGDNNAGVSGVCPQCRLMLVKKEPGEDGTAIAIRYAYEMGAQVINMSFLRGRTWIVEEQIALARTAGAVVVASVPEPITGIDECGTGLYGAQYVIAVGGSDNFDIRVPRSGTGPCLDLLAPGWVANTAPAVSEKNDSSKFWPHVSGIVTTDQTGAAGQNSDKASTIGCKLLPESADLDYTMCFSGTSAAAPIVSGVVGLMKSLNQNLSVDDVTDILHKTADKIDGAAAAYDANGQSTTHGFGRVNAMCALRWIQGSTDCTPVVTEAPAETPTETDPPTGTDPPAGNVTSGNLITAPVELGVRAGFSFFRGGPDDRNVLNVPGAGPRARPVVYVDWLIGTNWMLEGQLGYSRTWDAESMPDETRWGAAIQLAYTYGLAYVGIQAAVDRVSISGGTSTTDWAWGAAIGVRYLPTSFFALRAEALYRHWPTSSPTELGLALGAGVVF